MPIDINEHDKKNITYTPGYAVLVDVYKKNPSTPKIDVEHPFRITLAKEALADTFESLKTHLMIVANCARKSLKEQTKKDVIVSVDIEELQDNSITVVFYPHEINQVINIDNERSHYY